MLCDYFGFWWWWVCVWFGVFLFGFVVGWCFVCVLCISVVWFFGFLWFSCSLFVYFCVGVVSAALILVVFDFTVFYAYVICSFLGFVGLLVLCDCFVALVIVFNFVSCYLLFILLVCFWKFAVVSVSFVF